MPWVAKVLGFLPDTAEAAAGRRGIGTTLMRGISDVLAAIWPRSAAHPSRLGPRDPSAPARSRAASAPAEDPSGLEDHLDKRLIAGVQTGEPLAPLGQWSHCAHERLGVDAATGDHLDAGRVLAC